MNVVFRTDASTAIGHGHVMRCLTLASALARGSSAHFICREHPGDLCDLISSRGFRVTRLTNVHGFRPDARSEHLSWLGVPASVDATETRVAIESAGTSVDWLVVDHYALDASWERELRGTARRILVIDDLADRTHDCDLLLDQNLVEGMETRYDGKVPARCVKLLGPAFALLQREYAALHVEARLRVGAVRRLFVYFGGADAKNLTGATVSAFKRLERADVDVDVVVATGSPHAVSVRATASGRANIHLHEQLTTLAPLMAQADLAVGANGTATWERLCLGLPSLTVSVATNQRPIAEALHQRGLIRWIGNAADVGEQEIEHALRETLDVDLAPEWSRRCHAVVDGKGASRVCAALNDDALVLQFRRAGKADQDLLYEWRNHADTRRWMNNHDAIAPDAHAAWFNVAVRDPARQIWFAETKDRTPVGMLRFDLESEEAHLSYLIAPTYRGRGYGSAMLRCAVVQLFPRPRVVADVLRDNAASRRALESAGFTVESQTPDSVRYAREL